MKLSDTIVLNSGWLEAFSAGVMVLLSFVDLLWPASMVLGWSSSFVAFILGGLLFFVISYCVPDPAEEGWVKDIFTFSPSESRAKVLRLGIVIAIGISIHNFPEGMFVLHSEHPSSHETDNHAARAVCLLRISQRP